MLLIAVVYRCYLQELREMSVTSNFHTHKSCKSSEEWFAECMHELNVYCSKDLQMDDFRQSHNP